jgi:hypothetical protein
MTIERITTSLASINSDALALDSARIQAGTDLAAANTALAQAQADLFASQSSLTAANATVTAQIATIAQLNTEIVALKARIAELEAMPVMPTVTVAISPASVLENGAPNLVFTFTRSGSTAAPLSVNYTVSGTATIGSDYTGIATAGATKTVTFATGSAVAVVTVNPTGDTTVEANETVVLTIAAGSGYVIGTPNAATGTITNDDTAPPITGLPFPTGWNDPMFAAAAGNVQSYIGVSNGQVVQDITLDKGGQNGDAGACLSVSNNCTVRRVRINGREGIRGAFGSVDVSNVFVQVFANAAAGDHADAWQNYTPGNTINSSTVTIRNSHLRCSTTPGSNGAFFTGNDWGGRIVMENVWLAGGGYTACFGSDNRPDVRTLSSIDLKNVYMEDGNWMYGPLYPTLYWPTIVRWENVCVARINNGAIEVVRQIPRPA